MINVKFNFQIQRWFVVLVMAYVCLGFAAEVINFYRFYLKPPSWTSIERSSPKTVWKKSVKDI